MKVIRDSRAMTDMANDVSPRMSTEQIEAARKIVAGHPSNDVESTTELLFMLGLHPSQAGELDYLLGPGVPLNTDGPIRA